ncbi:response regulator [Halobacteriovorax sp. HFRX-2_2]|uniref:response regulator n=1 Tax=unclassified Halobacteriovorax TaxID=2639665 RepID=UPI0037161146
MGKEEMKVMIVDDSEISRTSVKDILEQENYEVVGCVGSAQDALKLAFDNPPTLFIIDVIMPGISGLELAESVASNFPNAKILMMSSLDIESVCIEAISSGAQDFLVKPFKREDLLRSVDKLTHDIASEKAS